MPMNPVFWFEMPAEDQKRMSAFYAKAFGWETKQLGPDMGNYTVVTTTETDAKGMPKKPMAINGGFYKKTDDKNTQHPSLVIRVDDIKKHVKKVEAAGGRILGDIMEIPGNGSYVSFIDTEGNRVSMMQPLPMP